MNGMLTSSCSHTHLTLSLFRISNSRRQVDLFVRAVYIANLYVLKKAIWLLFPVRHSALVALQRHPRTLDVRLGTGCLCRLPTAVARQYNITYNRSVGR